LAEAAAADRPCWVAAVAAAAAEVALWEGEEP
jgi:hypothetical protein